jgi:hypothetical protein
LTFFFAQKLHLVLLHWQGIRSRWFHHILYWHTTIRFICLRWWWWSRLILGMSLVNTLVLWCKNTSLIPISQVRMIPPSRIISIKIGIILVLWLWDHSHNINLICRVILKRWARISTMPLHHINFISLNLLWITYH